MSNANNQDGMTLIELVVVSVLVAALTGILYSALQGIMRARETTSRLRTTDQTAHYLFARITSELSGRSFVALNTKEDDQSQPSFGGVPRYLLGTNEESGEFNHDSIRFVSANAAQPFVGGPSNHGSVEVEYRLEDNPEESRIAFEGDGPKPLVLVRSEVPAGVRGDELLQKRKIVLPMAENVLSMNFRYLKGGAWQNDWKETTPPLPEAIEISLRLKEESGKSQLYRTAIPVSAKQRRQQP